MKTIYSLLFWAAVAQLSVAQAQQVQGGENSVEEAQVQPLRTDAASAEGSSAANATTSPTQKVLILNNQPINQQPTTYVEASPISESRADAMRKQRQDVEIQTEQKIVEKLETSRMEDEKERAERLFGDRWQQAPAPVVVAPAPVAVVPVQETQQIKEVKAEIVSDFKEEKKEESKTYISGILGTSEYPDVQNVESNYALGFAIGKSMSNNMQVEGSFLYSNYYVTEYWKVNPFKEMDQYNFDLAVKYSFLNGMIHPVVGVIGGYTYRKYSDRQFNNSYYWNQGHNSRETATHAVDLGVLVGVDIDVSDSMVIGADYRYKTNMFNKTDDDNMYYQDFMNPGFTTPVEELDYSAFLINAKFRF